MLPHEPETVEKLRLRYEDAVKEVYNLDKPITEDDLPGKKRVHVFDLENGLRFIISREISGRLLFPGDIHKNESFVGYTRDKKSGKRTNHLKDQAGTIKTTSGLGGNQGELVLISDSGLSRKKEEREIVPPLRANTGAGSNNVLSDNFRIRRLTPIECERLQGFPDNYTEGISDTQRYKCLGNAISVPVVEEIFRRLYGK